MAEGLTIDLITVSLYRLGDSQALVPQRVEPERVQASGGRTPPPPPRPKGTLFDGADAFIDSIDAAKETDRDELRRLADLLLSLEMLPESWAPPIEIQRLRDLTRLRHTLAEDRTRWAQRLHAFLVQEGWACQRGRLLTATGRRWVRALVLEPAASRHAERLLGVIEMLDLEITEIEREVRRFARSDRRTAALQTLYGIGPIIACTLLAEIGEAARFRRSAQVVRLAGLDPVVEESADTRRRGHLAKAGSPHLRWALVEAAMQAARPGHIDHQMLIEITRRADRTRARLSVARKIGRRAFHVLREAELAQAA